MSELIEMKYVVSALLYSGIGVVVFALCFIVFELLTPKANLWKELIEKQNIAFAIFIASIILGLALIISSAIHG